MPINTNPFPQTYNSTFGGIPGTIGLPSPFQDLAGAYPNLGTTNAAASGDIYAQLEGSLSPGTTNALRNAAAQWGVGAGMPGGPMVNNKALANVAGFAEGQVNQGLQNYGRIIPTVSQTQTVAPSTQIDLAAHNAAVNAAPNPQAAQSYAKQLFDQYLQALRGPGGGTASGTSPASGSGALGFGFGTLGPSTSTGTSGAGDLTLEDMYSMGFGDTPTAATSSDTPDMSYLQDIGAF